MEITCPKCAYGWDWQGGGVYADCPSCRFQFPAMHLERGDAGSKERGRSIPPLTPPGSVELGSFEGQRWILLTVQNILMSCVSLTPADIKILSDLRDSVKALKELDSVRALEEVKKRLDTLEGKV